MDITLNLSKISKDRITERTYKDKDGVEQTVKELKIRVVPLKEKKFITKGDTWEMYKTHFVVEKKNSKEEPDVFIGDGFTFETINQEVNTKPQSAPDYPTEDINVDDIPF